MLVVCVCCTIKCSRFFHTKTLRKRLCRKKCVPTYPSSGIKENYKHRRWRGARHRAGHEPPSHPRSGGRDYSKCGCCSWTFIFRGCLTSLQCQKFAPKVVFNCLMLFQFNYNTYNCKIAGCVLFVANAQFPSMSMNCSLNFSKSRR